MDKNRRWWSVYYSSVLFICFLYWLTVYLKSEAHIIVMCCSGLGWAGPPDNFCLVCLAIVAVMGCWGPARGDICSHSHHGSQNKDTLISGDRKKYIRVCFKSSKFLVDVRDTHKLSDVFTKLTWIRQKHYFIVLKQRKIS